MVVQKALPNSEDDAGGLSGVLLSVAYDGRPFSGFALQRDRRTVAGELLGAVRAVDPRVEEVRGASRTDAGVHAYDQRVAFDPERDLPIKAWLHGLAKNLPSEIAIRGAWFVERGLVPRFCAIQKTYRYLLLAEPFRDPFLDGRAWRIPELASREALSLLRAEALHAVGTHDFRAFRAAADTRPTSVRTLHSVEVSVDPERASLIRIDVTGSSFLYNMVRILVGALVDVGRGRRPPGIIEKAIASGDRRALGITAPPDGLYLQSTTLRDDETRGIASADETAPESSSL
ncbi:MAG: tRNA pseudouridine(38-40) synthase TruA [Polyangiaceae bacterium]